MTPINDALVERMEALDARILAEYADPKSTMRGIARKLGCTLDAVTEAVTDLAGTDRARAAQLSLAWQKTPKAAAWRKKQDTEPAPEPKPEFEARAQPDPQPPAVDVPVALADGSPPPVITVEDVRRAPDGMTMVLDNSTGVPEPERPTGVLSLAAIFAAEATGDAKLVGAATKVRDLLVALGTDVAEYEQQAMLREELAQIEARAAEIRAQLSTRRATPLNQTVDNKAVRAWAAENGIETHPAGMVPNRIVQSYLAAEGRKA